VVSQDNQVKDNLYSQKFAQYLNQPPTSEDGALEIHPKGAAANANGPVLEILQFSGLFVSGVSQTFSSEIRLGKLIHPDGRMEYFKGGNLSGSIKGNFSKVQWEGEPALTSVEGEYSFF